MSKKRLKKEESDLRKKVLIKMMKQFAKGLTLSQFMRLVNERVFIEDKWKVVYTTIMKVRDKYNNEHPDEPINFIDGKNVYPKDMPKLNKRAEDSELLKKQLQEYFTLFKTDKDKLIEKYNNMAQKKKQIVKPTKESYEDYKKKVIENNNKIEYIRQQLDEILSILKSFKDNNFQYNHNLVLRIVRIINELYSIQLTNKFYSVIIHKLLYQFDIFLENKFIHPTINEYMIYILENNITNPNIEEYKKIKYLFDKISELEQHKAYSNENKIDNYYINLNNIKNISIYDDIYIKYLNDIIDYIINNNLMPYLERCTPYSITFLEELLIKILLNNGIKIDIMIYDKDDFSMYLFEQNEDKNLIRTYEDTKEYESMTNLLKDLKQYIIKYKEYRK